MFTMNLVETHDGYNFFHGVEKVDSGIERDVWNIDTVEPPKYQFGIERKPITSGYYDREWIEGMKGVKFNMPIPVRVWMRRSCGMCVHPDRDGDWCSYKAKIVNDNDPACCRFDSCNPQYEKTLQALEAK